MAELHANGIPESIIERLRKLATEQQWTVDEVVVEMLQRGLAHLEFEEELSRRSRTTLGVSVADLLREIRFERDRDLSRSVGRWTS